MVAKKLRRRVRVLDTSNQLSLFAGLERAAGMTAAPRSAPRVKFESPDPRAIFINQVRLDEHLQAVGLTAPLRIRPLLEQLSLAEFEQAYRPAVVRRMRHGRWWG